MAVKTIPWGVQATPEQDLANVKKCNLLIDIDCKLPALNAEGARSLTYNFPISLRQVPVKNKQNVKCNL